MKRKKTYCLKGRKEKRWQARERNISKERQITENNGQVIKTMQEGKQRKERRERMDDKPDNITLKRKNEKRQW